MRPLISKCPKTGENEKFDLKMSKHKGKVGTLISKCQKKQREHENCDLKMPKNSGKCEL